MKILRVTKKEVDYKDFVKRSAKESDFDLLIKEPTTLVDADSGEILAIYDELNLDTDPVLKALNRIRYDTTQRVGGLKTTSRIFGFSPRVTMRKDFCSATSLSTQSPEEHGLICKLGMDIEKIYMQYHPEGFKRHQEETESRIKPNYRLEGKSIFTSGIINKNNPLKYHFDTGNFKKVYSCMVVFKKGIEGGYIALPEYRIGFELKHNSIFMFDGQSILHGVTPITKTSPAAIRYSIVYYSLQQMWACMTVDEELARIRNRKADREKRRHSKRQNVAVEDIKNQLAKRKK